MRFGFVARFTLALAVFALAIIIIRTVLVAPSVRVATDPVAVKQSITSSHLPDFSAIIDVKAKKIAFFNFIKPGIITANAKIIAERQFLLQLEPSALSLGDSTRLTKIAKYYRMALP